ncbi:hypothetical protein P5V15_001352 [Pogonomyrmex californicus]
MHIPYVRGVFMRDALPTSGARRKESGIVNLDDTMGSGTHWVRKEERPRRVFRQFWQSSTAQGTGMIFRRQCYDNRIQSNVLSDLRSERLRTAVPMVSPNGQRA